MFIYIYVHLFISGSNTEHSCWFTGRTSCNSPLQVSMRSPRQMPNIFGSVLLWGLMRSQKGKCPQDITIKINQKTSAWGNALAGMNQMSATCRLQKVLLVYHRIWIIIHKMILFWVITNTDIKKCFEYDCTGWQMTILSLHFDATRGVLVVGLVHFTWLFKVLCTHKDFSWKYPWLVPSPVSVQLWDGHSVICHK